MRTTQDKGFSLVEVAVVMLILGILAGVGVPIYLTSRDKAQSSAAKIDAGNMGKAVLAYYTGSNGSLTVSAAGLDWTIEDAAGETEQGRLSPGNQLDPASFATGPTAFCVGVQAPKGEPSWHYRPGGLVQGTCS